jgi:hypothetical protein
LAFISQIGDEITQRSVNLSDCAFRRDAKRKRKTSAVLNEFLCSRGFCIDSRIASNVAQESGSLGWRQQVERESARPVTDYQPRETASAGDHRQATVRTRQEWPNLIGRNGVIKNDEDLAPIQ